MKSEPGVSLIIPAWHEADRIGPTLEGYLFALSHLGTPLEIIVVMDGVGDGTEHVVDRFADRGVRKLVFPEKLGKGGAVLAGFRSARYNYLGYVDADGAVPPHELTKMVKLLEHSDCVVASRWLRKSRVVRREPLFNIVAGRFYNFLVRSLLFLPVHDTQCGAKFLRREVAHHALNSTAITNRAFEAWLLYHIQKSGGKILEVPTEWSHDGRSRMPIGKAIPVMFLSLVGVRMMNSPMRKYMPRRLVKALGARWRAV